MSTLSRRALLRGAALATGAAAPVRVLTLPAAAQLPGSASGEASGDAGEDWVRVYLVVVDGLRPDEVAQMPTLAQLAADGWYYPDSRAQMIAETTPNHVSMITGMRVDRHGMPGNDVAFLDDNVGLEPRYLQTDSLFTLIARQAPELVTTAATAKDYIVQMSKHGRVDDGTEDADATNDPFIVPVSGSAIDLEVGPDALAQSVDLDPDLGWMSLGDVDRVGHVDETGGVGEITGTTPVARTLVLQTADRQVANLVTELQDSGRWANTVMLVTADHSMDWSRPDSIVSLSGAFEEDPDLTGQFTVAQNGGAAIYALLAPAAEGAGARLKAMRDIAMATEGVLEAWYTQPNPADGGEVRWVGATRPDWGLTGDRTGDLVVVAEEGWRITEPSSTSNPIPGNHGHIATLPIAQIVAGGWDGLVANDAVPAAGVGTGVDPDVRLEAQGENIDMAPTAAWLLGIHPPPGGFDGRVLTEAFSRRPAPRVAVADVPSVPRVGEVAGPSRFATAVALSRATFPSATDDAGDPVVATLVVASGEDFPDALAATPLAVASGGPLLLVGQDRLPVEVAEEISRLSPSTVLVVGGEAAVSAGVAQAISDLGVETVTRLAGPTRYATGAAIARALLDGGSTDSPLPVGAAFAQDEAGNGPDVIVASGEDFPDALAAGPLAGTTGRIILLTRRGELPAETAEVLAEVNPARVIVAGGSAAVGAAVEAALGEGATVERLGGSSRFATAAALVERTIREGGFTDRAFLVDAGGFPDALAAGAAVARLGGMLLPVSPDGLDRSGDVADLLLRRADGLVEVTWVGGTGVLPASLREEVEAALLARRTR